MNATKKPRSDSNTSVSDQKTTGNKSTSRTRRSRRTQRKPALSNRLTEDVELIAEAVERAIDGEFVAKIDVEDDNAVGQLADGLQSLLDKTSEDRKRLHEYRAQIEAISRCQATIEYEADGTIRSANSNFLTLLGYQSTEIVGQHHRIFIDPEEANGQAYSQFWTQLSIGESKSGEFKRVTKQGTEVWVSGFYTPIRDEEGRIYKVIENAIDVTSAKKKEEESRKINAMMERAKAMIFADPDCTIRYMNTAAFKTLQGLEEHLPVCASEIVGQSIDIFHKHPEHQRKILADPSKLPVTARIEVGPETLELTVNSVFDDERQYLGGMVTWEIVTEKLAMEKKIRERAEQDRITAEETRQKADQILAVVNQIADGGFDVEIPHLGDDALGQVAVALDRAVQSVRSTLSQTRNVSSTVATASYEMTGAAMEISRGAQQQAASLEETASSLEEITNTVKQNSENAQEARSLADNSRDVATDGGEVVGNAVQAMREINESSKKISDIITTIDEIAFQTNLLALNAAVEAARAGEQGRGFAVVAAEVRNLAQRSASSAKEIKGLIVDSASKVERGTELVNKSGETLGEIVDSVKRVTDIVSEIAAASKEQLTAIELVTQAVTDMDQVTQANASQTEELAGTSKSVLEHSEELDSLVSRFRLGDESTQPLGSHQMAPQQQSFATHPQAAMGQNASAPASRPVEAPQARTQDFSTPMQKPASGCPVSHDKKGERDEFMEF